MKKKTIKVMRLEKKNIVEMMLKLRLETIQDHLKPLDRWEETSRDGWSDRAPLVLRHGL